MTIEKSPAFHPGSRSAGFPMSLSLKFGLMVVGVALLFPLSGRAADGSMTCVTDDFEGGKGLASLGWRVKATPEQSRWSVRDDCLEIVGHRNPYKGGSITKEVPLIERGTLEFDANFATTGRGDYHHFSLGFKLYGQMTAFKNYGTHAWLQYRPEGNTWTTLATGVPLGEWVRIKVVFDFPAKRVEYYCGAGEDPVYIDPAFDPDLSEAPKELVFFNYGLCTGTITNLVDNIRLTGGAEAQTGSRLVRSKLVLFEGMSAERYAVRQALATQFAETDVAVYPMVTRGSAIAPRNIFRLQRVPARRRLDEASLIVLADVPTEPDACFPPYLLKDIAAAVRDGAHLLVLPGLFALGKGGYQHTPLAELLPIKELTPWNARRFATPMPLSGSLLKATQHLSPTVLWYHAPPETVAGTAVLLEADGQPMALRREVGEGTVTVSLAMACGDFGTTGEKPFWESPVWPELLRLLATPTRTN